MLPVVYTDTAAVVVAAGARAAGDGAQLRDEAFEQLIDLFFNGPTQRIAKEPRLRYTVGKHLDQLA